MGGADVGVVGQFVEDAAFGQAAFPFREPLQGMVGERDSDVFPFVVGPPLDGAAHQDGAK